MIFLVLEFKMSFTKSHLLVFSVNHVSKFGNYTNNNNNNNKRTISKMADVWLATPLIKTFNINAMFLYPVSYLFSLNPFYIKFILLSNCQCSSTLWSSVGPPNDLTRTGRLLGLQHSLTGLRSTGHWATDSRYGGSFLDPSRYLFIVFLSKCTVSGC